MRWSNGKPFLQSVTAHWMLTQWDWRREPPNQQLMGAPELAIPVRIAEAPQP